jgi:hypothetical protein
VILAAKLHGGHTTLHRREHDLAQLSPSCVVRANYEVEGKIRFPVVHGVSAMRAR